MTAGEDRGGAAAGRPRAGRWRRLAALAREDLRLTLRERSSIFWIFIAPALWVAFFSTFNRPQDPSQAKIGLGVVVAGATGAEDPMAAQLIANLRAENFDVTTLRPDGPSADPAAKAGDLPPRRLSIPADLAGAIARRQKVTLELREDRGADPSGTFATRVAIHRAILRLLGNEASHGAFQPADDLVTVASSWGGGRPIPSGNYQTVPGNLVMFVLIASVTYGSALLAGERRSGILRRLAASPLRRAEIIAGKLAGRAAVALVQVGVFVVISLVLFRIDWGRSPAGLILLVLALVCAAAAIGLLGGSLFRSADSASGAGVVAVLVMSALGGCWWPSEVMPAWMRTASYAFPTAWAMNGLHQLLSWGGGLRDVLPHCGVLAVYALGAAGLASYRLRRSD